MKFGKGRLQLEVEEDDEEVGSIRAEQRRVQNRAVRGLQVGSKELAAAKETLDSTLTDVQRSIRWDPYVKLTLKLTPSLKLWKARSRLYRRQF